MNTHLNDSKIRTAVIGAGACGLIGAKCLLDEGIEVVVFEQSSIIGGVWNYAEDLPDGGSPAYRSLRTNTSKQMMALSDFPFPDRLPDFPSREEVLQYLHDYAEHFGLQEHIQLNTTVEQITRQPQNRWNVTIRSNNGARRDEIVDAVLVCSGLHRSPAIPHYPGSDGFQGQMLHSASYKGPEGYEDKAIVVIGAGSSGLDIAAELSKVARSVVLSTRKGAWFLPHYIGRSPYDHQLTRLSAMLPFRMRMFIFRQLVLREYRRLGVGYRLLSGEMPQPKFDVWRARLTPGSEFLKAVARGTVVVKPGVTQIEADKVVFANGTRAAADTIIYCTGYTFNFPFLEPSLVEVQGDRVELYWHVFHPGLPNLAFIGYCIVGGPLWPVAELQARWAAGVFSGAIKLPEVSQMVQVMQRQREKYSQLGVHPMRIQLVDYMDEIARSIGARPSFLDHPGLMFRLLAGPLTASQYRLGGSRRPLKQEREV